MISESSEGISRREALRRGTMSGLGLVWAAPTVERLTLSAQFAQAGTPVAEVADEVEDVTVEPDVEDDVEDEVLAEELPFTGMPAEQLIPVAVGLVATGAVALRLARERRQATAPEGDT